METNRDNYALDLIKIFGWDEKDIDVDRTTFCTYAKCKDQSQSTTTTTKPTTTTIKPIVELWGKIIEKLYEIYDIVDQLEDQNESTTTTTKPTTTTTQEPKWVEDQNEFEVKSIWPRDVKVCEFAISLRFIQN